MKNSQKRRFKLIMFSRKVKHETSSKVTVFLPIFKSSHLPINMFKLQKTVRLYSQHVCWNVIGGEITYPTWESWENHRKCQLLGDMLVSGRVIFTSNSQCVDWLSCWFKNKSHTDWIRLLILISTEIPQKHFIMSDVFAIQKVLLSRYQ